jgi:hypothetical protein
MQLVCYTFNIDATKQFALIDGYDFRKKKQQDKQNLGFSQMSFAITRNDIDNHYNTIKIRQEIHWYVQRR